MKNSLSDQRSILDEGLNSTQGYFDFDRDGDLDSFIY